MPKGLQGFQKRHKGFRTRDSYIKAGEKISQSKIGHFVSKKTREKISKANKGMLAWNKGKPNPVAKNLPHLFKKGQKSWNKGKTGWMSKQGKESLRKFNLGKKASEETKKKMSQVRKKLGITPPHQKGENHRWWKGGITPINQRIRSSLEYRLWRKAVFERDNYQCIWGGKKHGNKLQADHIKPFAFYPEMRFDINNGRTLCRLCHMKTPTFLRKTRSPII